jgi:hypothetical protein
MKEWFTLIITGAGLLGGILAVGWLAVTGFKARVDKAARAVEAAGEAVEAANSKVVEVVRLEADAWRKRYEGEHQEALEYRERAHTHANESNSLVLRLTAENAELRSKTDLSPVLKFHQEQSEINGKIVGALDKIVRHLDLATGQSID